MVWIINRQTFKRGGGIERSIGCNQSQSRRADGKAFVIGGQSSGELNGIITAQAVNFGEKHRTIGERRTDFDDGITTEKTTLKSPNRFIGLARRQTSAARPPRQCGNDFNRRNTGDINRVSA